MSYKPLPPKQRRPVADEGSLRAFEYYAAKLKKLGYKPINQTESVDGDTTDPTHLLWMCTFCQTQVRDDGLGMNVAKYSRWLGYIQGCLISQKITTVEAERNRTRPWFSDH